MQDADHAVGVWFPDLLRLHVAGAMILTRHCTQFAPEALELYAESFEEDWQIAAASADVDRS